MYCLSVVILSLVVAAAVAGGKGGYENKVYNRGPYYKKYECKKNSDCIKGYICSDNYCVPDCGPCSEFDFTTGYCRYECAKNAKCVQRGKYNFECFCPYCPGMDGYNKVANCIPPKYLRGICYSYDPLSKAPAPKHVRDYYQYNKGQFGNYL